LVSLSRSIRTKLTLPAIIFEGLKRCFNPKAEFLYHQHRAGACGELVCSKGAILSIDLLTFFSFISPHTQDGSDIASFMKRMKRICLILEHHFA
jgi:hypothetical protein